MLDLPTAAASAQDADKGHSFVVAKRDASGGQQAVHSGFFLTIADAERYRRLQPNGNMLSITLLIERFPIRDLLDAEIFSGQVHPAEALTMDEHSRQWDAVVNLRSGTPSLEL